MKVDNKKIVGVVQDENNFDINNTRIVVAIFILKFLGILGITLLFLTSNIVSSYLGFSSIGSNSYNQLNGSGSEFMFFSLLVSVAMIVLPSAVFMFFYGKLREASRGLLKLNFIEKILAVILISAGVVSQIASTLMTYEAIYYSRFRDYIESELIEHRKHLSNRKEYLKIREDHILNGIKALNVRIEDNDKRIKLASDTHMKLDYTFKTNKENLLKEIERAEASNRKLRAERDVKFEELKNHKKETVKFNLKDLRLQGFYVLLGSSSVVSANDTANVVYCWMLFMISLMLDLFLISSFYMLRNSMNELILIRNSYKKARLNGQARQIPLTDELCHAIEVVSGNLEVDNRTVKSINSIHENTKISIHNLRKMTQLLIDRGLILKDEAQNRLVLNTESVLGLSKSLNGNQISQDFKKVLSILLTRVGGVA
nr:hypothetical protein LKV13_04530 [Borrelia sp. BU AG58]